MRHPFLRTLAGSAATPTDPNFENVTLLLHGDGTNGGQNNTFVDGSTNNFTITRNGNTTQGTFSPYGDNWSNYFDGTGDRLKFPDSADWDFGTGDFTIEFWFSLNVVPTASSTARQSFVSHYAATTPAIGWNCQLGEAPDNKVNFGWGDTALAVSAARTWSTNRWYHYAVARSGTSLKLFIDGEQVASVTDSTNMTGSSNSCTVGALNLAVLPSESFIQHVNGYVSNVRILKGTALYTSAFTTPTAPLTAITNTVLLTCQSNRFKDNSSSNRTATRDGDVSVQRFSPFSPTSAYAAGTIGGSGYFDGTTDYLSASANSAFEFGTGNFTIECFFYPTSTDSSQYLYVLDATGGIIFGFDTSIGVASFVLGRRGTGFDLVASYTIVPFQWLHLTAVRSGTTASLYINGARVTTGTNSLNYTVNGPVNVGGIATASANEANGYISDLRVVKGTAVYDPTQTTLTVPTAPLTAITNTSLLLNFTNAAILDNAMMAVPETLGNAQIDTTTKKYGTGSLEFDGTGDWLLVPDSIDQRLGTGNFTIECWLYLSATGTARGIVGKGTSTTGWLLSTNTSNAVVFTYGTSTITSTGTLSGTTWYHIAVVREGTGTNQTKIYIGGTNDGTGTVSTDFTQTNAAYVGANRTGGDPMNGYIDDLRITKGVARYTSNFTAPTAAFPDL